MRKVYIAQLLCPQRHCVLAAAGEFDSPEDALSLAYKLSQTFGEACIAGLLNHKCELCGATDLKVEVAPTRFRTMEEAREPMAQLERQQGATRAFLRSSRN